MVINFHMITDSSWFENVLCYLKSKYELVDIKTLEETLSSKEKGKNICHMTVDDGDHTFIANIYPILLKHQVPATIFVSPKISVSKENFWFQEIRFYDKTIMIECISEETNIPIKQIECYDFSFVLKCLNIRTIKNIITLYQKRTQTPPKPFQNMTIEEIVEIDRKGLVTIGAHTLNHPVLKNEDNNTCNHEIVNSIRLLEDYLGHKIKHFAYPNGIPQLDFTEREINILKAEDITLAFSTEPKHFSSRNNRLSVPRIGLSGGSINFIRGKLFMGRHWETIKHFRYPDEALTRKKIYEIAKVQLTI